MKGVVHAAVCVTLALGASSVRPGAQPGMMMGQERKLVAQFDRDGDKRLNLAERQTAREWLASQPQMGPGGGRRGGPFGGGFAEPPAAGPKLTPADVKKYGAEPLYDAATIRTLFLQFESAEWEKELAAFNNTDVEVPATVTVDGRVYPEVGVHYRGASSYFMVPEGRKKSLNLSFDFVKKDQRLGGHRTLNLLNGNGDPSFLRPVLYTHIASQYLPTPKMNYARVVINGESWGLYISAQQFNRDFVRDSFKAAAGDRFKVPGSPNGRGGLKHIGTNVEDYKRVYEIASADRPEAWAALITLTDVLTNTPTERLEAALAPILDVDGALKFLALEVALVNSDGYFARASDYNLYRDPKGRFHIVPHDVNEGLGSGEGPGGRGRRGGPGGGRGGRGFMFAGPDLDPLVGIDDPEKPLRSRLLAVPGLRAKYLGQVREIATKWLDWKTLGPIAEKHHDLIAEHVEQDTKKLYSTEAFEGSLTALKDFADKRRAVLLEKTAPEQSK